MNKKFSIIISVLFLACFLCVLIPPVSPKTSLETLYTIEKAEINESNAKTYLTSTHSIRPDVDEKFSLYNRGSKYVSLTSDSYNVIVEKILNGYEYTLVINSPVSLKDNFVSFEVDTKGYTVTQDVSLLTELPKKDYKVWNETYAFDGQNETRKDISLVGCLRFIPDGKITEEFIIKRPYIYDANLVGVFGTQKLEGNTLTVCIPQEFLSNARFPIFVDPTYIFSDGFESGDFSAWTGIFGSPSAQNTIKHCGTYAMSATGETQYAFKTLNSTYTQVFSRVYWQASDSPAPGEYTYLSECRASDWDTVLAACGVWNDGGTIKWILAINGNSYYYTLGSCAADSWYCVETEYNSVSDTHKLWLNGVNVIEQNDSETGEVKYFKVGTPGDGFWGSAFYWDCVVVSDSYIGTEESTPTPTSEPTAEPTDEPTAEPTLTPLPTNEEGYGVFELLLLTAILVVINIVGLGFRVPLLNLVALIFSFTFIIIFETSNMSILLIAINCLVSVACLLKNLYGRKS